MSYTGDGGFTVYDTSSSDVVGYFETEREARTYRSALVRVNPHIPGMARNVVVLVRRGDGLRRLDLRRRVPA